MSGNGGAPRRDFEEFFSYAQSCGPNVKTEMGNMWDADEGWRTYMRVGDKTIAFAPGWGRKLARDLKGILAKRLITMSAEVRRTIGTDAVAAWLDDLDAQCKETMGMRAANVSPADVAGPERGMA